jgi:mannosyltransferase
LLTVAAAILRFIFLSSKSFWLDEGSSATFAAQPLKHLIGQMLRGEMAVYMPLYFVMLHCWGYFAGSSEISLRLPSVIFATATVPLIYSLGAELLDRRVGLMAALLLSVNAACVEFGQEARAYAMVGMLVTLSSLLLVRSIKRASLAGYVGYVLVGSLCAYAHLLGILVLPAQWLSLFLFGADRKTRLRLTACIAVVAIVSLPPIILSIHGVHGELSWIPATSRAMVIYLFARFAGLYGVEMKGLSLFAIYLAAIAIAVIGASRRELPVVGFLLLSVALPVGIVLAVSIFKPILVIRYLLICQPFFVLLAATGIMRIKPRAVMVAITVLIVALSLSEDRIFYDDPPKQDWRGAIKFVVANAKSGDVLWVFPFWNVAPVDYYVGRLAVRGYFRVISDTPTLDGPGGASSAQAGQLQRFLAMHGVDSYTRIWVVTDRKHRNEPAMRELEAGHQVTAGPDLAGLFLVRID